MKFLDSVVSKGESDHLHFDNLHFWRWVLQNTKCWIVITQCLYPIVWITRIGFRAYHSTRRPWPGLNPQLGSSTKARWHWANIVSHHWQSVCLTDGVRFLAELVGGTLEAARKMRWSSGLGSVWLVKMDVVNILNVGFFVSNTYRQHMSTIIPVFGERIHKSTEYDCVYVMLRS